MIHLTVINTSRVNWLTAPPADVAQAACATYQGVFSPADISSYWSNPAGSGSFVKIKFAQILLYHPVSWDNHEIVLTARVVAAHGVMPCMMNDKGQRLVDVQAIEGSVVVEVTETVVQISEKLEASRAMSHLAAEVSK